MKISMKLEEYFKSKGFIYFSLVHDKKVNEKIIASLIKEQRKARSDYSRGYTDGQ